MSADLDQQIYDFRRDVSPERVDHILAELNPLRSISADKITEVRVSKSFSSGTIYLTAHLVVPLIKASLNWGSFQKRRSGTCY